MEQKENKENLQEQELNEEDLKNVNGGYDSGHAYTTSKHVTTRPIVRPK